MRFTRFFAKRYLPVGNEWTPDDEEALRSILGTEAYRALLKKIENRMADRQSDGISNRDIYALERMEELADLKEDLERMTEGEASKPIQRSPTRLEDYQP